MAVVAAKLFQCAAPSCLRIGMGGVDAERLFIAAKRISGAAHCGKDVSPACMRVDKFGVDCDRLIVTDEGLV